MAKNQLCNRILQEKPDALHISNIKDVVHFVLFTAFLRTFKKIFILHVLIEVELSLISLYAVVFILHLFIWFVDFV